MWREGVLYHEIATVFDISCGDVHRLIRERVPAAERSARPAAPAEDVRSSATRILDGIRRAQNELAEGRAIKADVRRLARTLMDGWLAAHPELTETPDAAPPSRTTQAPEAAPPSEPTKAVADRTSDSERVRPAGLRGELDHFRAELRAGGLRESTIHAYLTGSSLFVRWLAGDYVPGVGPRRAPADERMT